MDCLCNVGQRCHFPDCGGKGEPDRFEARAKELCLTEWRSIAAALRDAADEALERAAQAFNDEFMRTGKLRTGFDVADDLRAMKRALASPAAAPAAVHCPHGKGNEPCGVCDSEPAPLLPRVLAALEWEATLHAIGRARHVVLTDLAAELRAYIAEREPAEKRIAELEAECSTRNCYSTDLYAIANDAIECARRWGGKDADYATATLLARRREADTRCREGLATNKLAARAAKAKGEGT